ncbi:MAG: R2-like ligand-binding oxidase [Chloroflexi bacterium]|nr:R2-like ligand-binding oxidase [Chloroflexota bacterium]
MSPKHDQFVTLTRGLRRYTPPMRLFEKAKQLGIWNPSDIDFSQDVVDWRGLKPDEQDLILRLTAMFQAGEEAVTLDLLPLIMTIAREGRTEEEMFLTTFLWEEAKHVDFFSRFLTEVVGGPQDLSGYTSASYRAIVYEALPQALDRLQREPTPAVLVEASVTYNMIVEGVLAETGYQGYLTALQQNGLMPGQCKGITLLKQDESRHIAYGIFLISRLVAEDESLWKVAMATMDRLMPLALNVVTEIFAPYEVPPFGLEVNEFLNYASMHYQKRYHRIAAARGASLDDVYRTTHAIIERGDG